MDTECGATGQLTDVPISHTCRCARPRHSADGSEHLCTCGVRWTDPLEATFGLTPEERLTVEEFLRLRDYSERMNAFSVDVGGALARRVGAILERLLKADHGLGEGSHE